MIKKLALFLLMAALMTTPVLASSENGVDRTLAVKEDYTFEPGKAFSTLRIEEASPNEFGDEPVTFKLRITNAQWFEMGDPATADPGAMESGTVASAGAEIEIQRIGDRELLVTLDRSNVPTTEEAYWRIPIYGEVTNAGLVNLEIDGLDTTVSSGVYKIAEAHGDNYLPKGYSFTPENPQWMTLQEPTAGAFDDTETFHLVLENGSWYPETDTRLSPQAMLKNASISGIEAGGIGEIERVDDSTLKITLKRGAGSSEQVKGVWSIPLYFKVDDFGLAKVTVTDSQDKPVSIGTLGKDKVVAPIRYIKTVTLTLNQPAIVMHHGLVERTVTLDIAPVNPSGSTLIPVRGVFEQLGGSVQWDNASRTVTIKAEGKTIVIPADSASATLNGAPITLSQKPVVINSRLLIPLRSVSEQLGFGVEWLEASQKIIIRQD